MSDEKDNDQGQQQSQDDQAANQSQNDHSADENSGDENNSDDQNNNQEQTVEIDGEEVLISELKAGYMRGKDYTHKTQELAKTQRNGTQQDSVVNVDMNDPEAQKTLKILKGLGIATQQDIDSRLSQLEISQRQQAKLDKLVDANPNLKPFKKAIEALGKTTGEAWEDIVHKYGFAQKTNLQRAKASGEIKGKPNSKVQTQQKAIKDMNEAEYEEWRKSNLGKSTNFTRLTK